MKSNINERIVILFILLLLINYPFATFYFTRDNYCRGTLLTKKPRRYPLKCNVWTHYKKTTQPTF